LRFPYLYYLLLYTILYLYLYILLKSKGYIERIVRPRRGSRTITPNEKREWLLSCINATTYTPETGEIDITNTLTDTEKMQYIADRLKSESFYEYNVKRFHGNEQTIIADHLQGLPSWLNIPFMNYDILQLAIKWGYNVSTEKKENAYLARYWGAVAMEIIKACRKYKVVLG